MATINTKDYYTADQAAKRLSTNSGKTIGVDYPRRLAAYGKVKTFKLSDRAVLYRKTDIDSYVVGRAGRPPVRKRQEGKIKDGD